MERLCLLGVVTVTLTTNLQSANFTEATQYSINILENQVQGAKFSKHEAVYLLEGLGIELVD